MARFYFHLVNDHIVEDVEGIELAHFSEAVREAELAARELLADAIKASRSRVPAAVLITDESGKELHSLPMAAVLPAPLKR
jgi:hypothetical protein